MKINSLQLMPTKNQSFSALEHEKLSVLWKKSQSDLPTALAELSRLDARHELKITTTEQVSLFDWLTNHFHKLMEEHAEYTQLGKAVCASLWHKQLVELIFPTLVSLRFQYHLVPDFHPQSIMLDIEPNGRINTISIPNVDSHLSSHVGQSLEDPLMLDSHLSKEIINFSEMLAPIFAEQNVNTRRYWGNLSNALVQGFTRLSDKQKMNADVSATVNAWLLSILGEKQTLVEAKAIGEMDNHYLFARRKVCCLKYKLNKDRMCKTCNLKDEAEQEAFYKNKYLV